MHNDACLFNYTQFQEELQVNNYGQSRFHDVFRSWKDFHHKRNDFFYCIIHHFRRCLKLDFMKNSDIIYVHF